LPLVYGENCQVEKVLFPDNRGTLSLCGAKKKKCHFYLSILDPCVERHSQKSLFPTTGDGTKYLLFQ
jgi:hypothetical protein